MFEGIEAFYSVGKTLSFSQAAKELNTSVANISRKIKYLEQRLGTKLINRTTRVVKLTDIGEQYLQQCAKIITSMQDINDQFTDTSKTLSGKIKITAAGLIAETAIADIISRYAVAHPEVVIDIRYEGRNVNLVSENVDFAIRYGPLSDSSYIAKKDTFQTSGLCRKPGLFASKWHAISSG